MLILFSTFKSYFFFYSDSAVPDPAFAESDPTEEGEIPEAFPDHPGMPLLCTLVFIYPFRVFISFLFMS